MRSDESAAQPIERLKWEHARILAEVGALAVAAGDEKAASVDLSSRVAGVLKFLERHQEAEERFLLPLVPQLDGGLFRIIYEEHLSFLYLSDMLLAADESEDHELLSEYLARFKKELEAHFAREEGAVFKNSAAILSPAQKDILRINFASRKGKEI